MMNAIGYKHVFYDVEIAAKVECDAGYHPRMSLDMSIDLKTEYKHGLGLSGDYAYKFCDDINEVRLKCSAQQFLAALEMRSGVESLEIVPYVLDRCENASPLRIETNRTGNVIQLKFTRESGETFFMHFSESHLSRWLHGSRKMLELELGTPHNCDR